MRNARARNLMRGWRVVNPRRACAARVTVVGSVCLCVCLLSHISPMERLFVLKTLSRTQRATKVKKFVGFSLKPLRCRDPALPPLYGHAYSRPFFSCTRMRISRVYTRMIHRRGFSTLVHFVAIYRPRERTAHDHMYVCTYVRTIERAYLT